MDTNATKTKKSYYVTEQKMIQNYGMLFENLNTQQDLKNELAEYGYSDTEIAVGKTLYDTANEKYSANIKETQEETTAHQVFEQKMNEIAEIFATDRKKARIVFKDQPDVLLNLRLKGRIAQSISSLLDDMRVFYTTLQQNIELANPLNRLKVTYDHINSQVQKITEVEKSYSDYNREKAESQQQATKNKNKAFRDLEKWVREFYAIAKIALEDRPQLLEAVGKFVRS